VRRVVAELLDLRYKAGNHRGGVWEREMTTDSGDSGGGILVVDDDEGFRGYICELFESIGYETRQLASGDAVLPSVADERPAAILLDVQLPGLNGYEVCRELRSRYGDSIPIVFISGERTEALDRAGGLLLGADDYVIKPVDPGELIARVKRLVDRPRSNGKPGGSSERLESLTPREHQVLDLLAEGLQQEDIASRLVISPKTVATHIQRILGKLEVRSRAQAVSVVLRDDRDVIGHDIRAPFDLPV
jgi:DNA-binding NarL/FixJ family response regulator